MAERYNPYPEKNRPTVVSKRKHEAQVLMMQKKLDSLTEEVERLRCDQQAFEAAYLSEVKQNKRLNTIIDRIIGHE